MNDFSQIQNNIKETVLRLPVVLGNAAVNWVIDSFEKQAWRGLTIEQWANRSPKAARNVGRALLINTGRLRRSFRILKLNENSVAFGSDLPYAEAHNTGVHGQVSIGSFSRSKFGKAKASNISSKRTKSVSYLASTHQVKSHTRNMNLPRRQMMPTDESNSPIFQADMEAIIRAELATFFGKN